MKISFADIGATGVDVFGEAATRAIDCVGRDVSDFDVGAETEVTFGTEAPYGCGAKLCIRRADDDDDFVAFPLSGASTGGSENCLGGGGLVKGWGGGGPVEMKPGDDVGTCCDCALRCVDCPANFVLNGNDWYLESCLLITPPLLCVANCDLMTSFVTSRCCGLM